LDVNYYWENGLIDNDEKHLYQVVPKLWSIGEASPNDLKFVLKIFYGTLQPNKTLNYLVWSYHHELGKMLIWYEYANVTIKNKSCILVNSRLLKSSKLTIDHLEVVK
jgi:hypothetical protein